jgi:PEGA domain
VRHAWLVGLVVGCAAGPTVRGEPLPAARVTTRSELVLRCEPKDAEVSLEGVPQGRCDDFAGEPKGLTLKKGAHRVGVKKDGFYPWDSVVEADGTRVVLDVTLIQTGGTP